MLSDLTGSIFPAAGNAQHYITGIKYSGAQYTQVNLCTFAHLSSTKEETAHTSVKGDSSTTDLYYKVI